MNEISCCEFECYEKDPRLRPRYFFSQLSAKLIIAAFLFNLPRLFVRNIRITVRTGVIATPSQTGKIGTTDERDTINDTSSSGGADRMRQRFGFVRLIRTRRKDSDQRSTRQSESQSGFSGTSQTAIASAESAIDGICSHGAAVSGYHCA